MANTMKPWTGDDDHSESVRIHQIGRKPVWLLGFVGVLAILGVRGLLAGDPIHLFWFGFAGFLSFFRFRWEPMKYAGWLGILGLVLAIAAVAGVVPV